MISLERKPVIALESQPTVAAEPQPPATSDSVPRAEPLIGSAHPDRRRAGVRRSSQSSLR